MLAAEPCTDAAGETGTGVVELDEPPPQPLRASMSTSGRTPPVDMTIRIEAILSRDG